MITRYLDSNQGNKKNYRKRKAHQRKWECKNKENTM